MMAKASIIKSLCVLQLHAAPFFPLAFYLQCISWMLRIKGLEVKIHDIETKLLKQLSRNIVFIVKYHIWLYIVLILISCLLLIVVVITNITLLFILINITFYKVN